MTGIQKILIVGVILMGLCRPVIYLFSHYTATRLEQFAFSPLPLAYDTEFFFTKVILTGQFLDGSRKVVHVSPEVQSRLGGPLTRVEAYGHGVGFFPLYPPELTEAIFNTPFASQEGYRKLLGF